MVIGSIKDEILLKKYANGLQGLSPADLRHYGRTFWEIYDLSNEWHFWQSTVKNNQYFGGRELILWWNEDLKIAIKNGYAYLRGDSAWGRKGVVVSQIGNLPSTIYSGNIFDTNCAVICPIKEEHLSCIWCFCSSKEFTEEVRKIDQKLNVTNATLVKVPFNIDHWQKVAEEKYPDGLPKPYSDDPTQWLFHGYPKPSENPLHVAVCRLLGYQWPAEKDEEMELTDEARQYIKDIRAFNHLSDEDGIVCIPSVNGEQPASERLRDYIKTVWQEDWDNNTISNLLKQVASNKFNLEQWLREEFFEQHIKLFHNRPFIWHIWDGRKDGFSALVNYHKLDKANLQKLIYTYLGDWIRQCEVKVHDNLSGADGMLMAAKKLKEKLEQILQGRPPYDIFIRWKPLEKQPIGWKPDINDGVRLNIYPFMQAGILRKKPNIKWGKDRGKNPPGTPWGPDRYNRYEDLADEHKLKDEQGRVISHLTNDVKRKARDETNKNNNN